MKKALVALSVALSLGATATIAEESQSISTAAKTDLMTVYQAALSNDTQYLISHANLKATEQGVRISRSSLLPQISASATKSRRDNDSTGQGLDGSPSDPFNRTSDSTTYQVRLTQSIFDWANWVALDQAGLRLKASELNHGSKLQDLMSRAAQAYFNVLSAEENLATTQAELEALKQQLDLTREQYESGLANATDYLNAQANYDQSLANEVSLKNSLNIAKESLRQITNNYYMALEGLGDEVELSEPSPNNIDDWTRVAAQENLGLKAQQANVKVAKKEIDRNRSGHYPSLNFDITYSDSDSDTDDLYPNGTTFGSTTLPPGTVLSSSGQSEGYSAGITLSVPIFSGFRTSAQTEQAKQNYLSSSHQHEQTARQVQASARNAFTNLQSAIASFKAYKRSLESNQSSLEATQEGYQAGTRNIIDVLTATRSYYNARRNLTRAKYDYLINGINLKLAAGTLTEADLQEVNQLLLKY
ncbi:MAG: TolC family outer membrane protein [Gammaproteobacteria bacterium]|nr:TolC family outer membrane protein [Gammaproteobacteria bacterium]